MNLKDILEQNLIIPNLIAEDKKGVLAELASVIASSYKSLNASYLEKVLLEREKLGSTGIGDGIAIPHGKLKDIDKPIIVFGRSKKGVDFEAIDKEKCSIFFLLFVPDNDSGLHLKLLARISRLLKDASFRKRLVEAKTKKEILNIILEEEERS